MSEFFSKVTINGMPYYQYMSLQGQSNSTMPKMTSNRTMTSSPKANINTSTNTATNVGVHNSNKKKLIPKVGTWPLKTKDGKYLKTQVLYQELGSDTFAFNFMDKNNDQVLKLKFSPKNRVFEIAHKAAVVAHEFTPEFAHSAGTQIINDSSALGKMPSELKDMIRNVNKTLSRIRL